MTPKTKQTWKWIGLGMASIGGGSAIVAVLFFALNAYIAAEVKSQTEKQLMKVPTIESVNNQLATINDGISDNAIAIGEIKVSQDEFKLLFIDYLRSEAEQ